MESLIKILVWCMGILSIIAGAMIIIPVFRGLFSMWGAWWGTTSLLLFAIVLMGIIVALCVAYEVVSMIEKILKALF